MTVISDEVKRKQYSHFLENMKNANNRLHKKMILRLSKCKRVLLMNNNSTKEKNFLPLLQLESLVSLRLILSWRLFLFSLCGELAKSKNESGF